VQLVKPETRRFIGVVIKFLPIGLRYRQDRREIRRAEGKLVHPEKYARHAKSAVATFIELGPAFIKLGQLLSVRPDVLPQPYINEFSRLQDEVPPAPFREVEPTIETALGRPIQEVFESFDENAVTGASLGQVYRARYQGKDVVVKVNRPNIRERVAIDTKVLKRLVPLIGRFIDSSLRFSVESVVDQFAETVRDEVNYKKEASNLTIIERNLKSEKTLIVPGLIRELSSERVIVLEYIDGIKIGDLKRLDDAGVDRHKLARRVARVYFRMLLSQEIFHADPHPGNLSVKPDGSVVLYDYGMVGELDDETRLNLVRFYTALVDTNAQRIVEVMLELGLLQPTANRYVIQRGVELALADMQGKKVEESEVKALMEVANRTIYQFPFKLPKNLVLYLRMLSILEGVCLALDPDFRFIRILGRLLEEEGLLEEAYMAEFKDQVSRLIKSIDATIDLAPILKDYVEIQQRREIHGERDRPQTGSARPLLSGALIGAGITGIGASIWFYGSAPSKEALAVSAVAFLIGVALARFRA
jgi:predicted unusual protein kinase regulating ubiquinone biosynthesis (AarF/ABC1/UbiB family)